MNNPLLPANPIQPLVGTLTGGSSPIPVDPGIAAIVAGLGSQGLLPSGFGSSPTANPGPVVAGGSGNPPNPGPGNTNPNTPVPGSHTVGYVTPDTPLQVMHPYAGVPFTVQNFGGVPVHDNGFANMISGVFNGQFPSMGRNFAAGHGVSNQVTNPAGISPQVMSFVQTHLPHLYGLIQHFHNQAVNPTAPPQPNPVTPNDALLQA